MDLPCNTFGFGSVLRRYKVEHVSAQARAIEKKVEQRDQENDQVKRALEHTLSHTQQVCRGIEGCGEGVASSACKVLSIECHPEELELLASGGVEKEITQHSWEIIEKRAGLAHEMGFKCSDPYTSSEYQANVKANCNHRSGNM
jgi:hypothetical protein